MTFTQLNPRLRAPVNNLICGTRVRVHRFGYPSPKAPLLFRLKLRRIPDYDDLARSLGPWLRAVVPDGDIAVVTHSQGGLILQRYLAWMLGEGRGRQLARIKLAVLLACPNSGSEFLTSARAVLGYNVHPQAGSLNVLNERVADTLRTVMRQAVNATGVSDSQCRIPFHVYAGDSDAIVPRASAQNTFPEAESLPGDHFTIIKPSTPGNITVPVLSRHLRDTFAETPDRGTGPPPRPPDTGTLKSVTRFFTGRTDEIGRITAAVEAVPGPRADRHRRHPSSPANKILLTNVAPLPRQDID
jgi:hypothetical protein